MIAGLAIRSPGCERAPRWIATVVEAAAEIRAARRRSGPAGAARAGSRSRTRAAASSTLESSRTPVISGSSREPRVTVLLVVAAWKASMTAASRSAASSSPSPISIASDQFWPG